MKKKQIIGVIIMAAAIILTGVIGVLSNVIEANLTGDSKNQSSGSFFSAIMAGADTEIILPVEDFVGVINVVGEIGPSTSDGIFSSTDGYDHDLNMRFVDEMMAADNNMGILLYIDSPGGTVYESDELYLKLMQYKNATGRPVWAYFASQACSGGYYIAMAADQIYANRNCWTGSIGVIISTINAEGLYEKIGIEEINITSGENKAMGSMGQEMTEEQVAILQSLVDEAYDQFVEIVCAGRKLDDATVRVLADGRIYSAKQALNNGLIDGICTYEDFVNTLRRDWNLDLYVTYYDPQGENGTELDGLFSTISALIPRNDAEVIEQFLDSRRSGVLMYYVQ